MRRRQALAVAAVLAGVPLSGAIAADAVELKPGTPLHLICSTKVVELRDGAVPTRGDVEILIELSSAATDSAPGQGTWKILSVADNHKGSIGAVHKADCANGCPVTAPAGQPVDLWAPDRVNPNTLPPDKVLSIAAVKLPSLELHATTIKETEVIALEQGSCKAAEGGSK